MATLVIRDILRFDLDHFIICNEMLFIIQFSCSLTNVFSFGYLRSFVLLLGVIILLFCECFCCTVFFSKKIKIYSNLFFWQSY